MDIKQTKISQSFCLKKTTFFLHNIEQNLAVAEKSKTDGESKKQTNR